MSTYTEITLSEVLKEIKLLIRYLLTKWIYILTISILGSTIGILFATFTKPKYESMLSFALESGDGGLSGAASLAASFGFNIGSGGGDIFSGDNILEILKSRKIIEEVLLTIDTINNKPQRIIEYWIKVNKYQFQKEKIASYAVDQNRANFTYYQDSILYVIHQKVLQNLKANRREKNLNIFDVKYISNDEYLTRRLTQELVKKTIAYYTELKTKKSKDLLLSLEERVNKLENSTKAAITVKGKIQDSDINPAFASQSTTLQIKQLDASIYGAAYTELYKNLEIARYQFLRNVPLLQIIDDANYPMKRIKPRRLTYGLIGGILGALAISLYFYLGYTRRGNIQ